MKGFDKDTQNIVTADGVEIKVYQLRELCVSRTFLSSQAGGKEAQTQQKYEIHETLRAD